MHLKGLGILGQCWSLQSSKFYYSQVNKLEEIITDQRKRKIRDDGTSFSVLDDMGESMRRKLRKDLESREETDFINVFDREQISRSHLNTDNKYRVHIENEPSSVMIDDYHSKQSDITLPINKETQTIQIKVEDQKDEDESLLLYPIASSIKANMQTSSNPFETVKRTNQA